MNREKILITAALPYANGPLHFGHMAGAYLPADCYARFQRLKQRDVLFICGSDEYGIAIAMSAEQAGISPQEHVDRFHMLNMKIFSQLHISFDHYSRTTWPQHVETVYQFFDELLANGFIEKKETEQLYSEKEERFFADRYVVGTCPRCGFDQARGDECTKCAASYEATDLLQPRSKTTGTPLTLRKTTHWFLRLDLFKERLHEWIESKQWKPNVVNFIKDYIDNLRPRSITRDTYWGIPVPLSEGKGKVLYVWFDAPIGYISATKEWALLKNSPEKWKEYWCDPRTKLVQFIGKDNIPFHAVIFPAMIMGQNHPYKLVDELPANEFYNLEGRQFSKSDNWFIDLMEFLKKYSADQIRYAIASNAPETSDSEFTWKDFQLKCNVDLVGKFGNFVHRTCVFIQNQCQGCMPPIGTLDHRDREFLNTVDALVAEISLAYESFKLRRVCQLIMELASHGNIYFDAQKPWQDAKTAERPRMYTTIACCVQCVKALAVVAFPVIPQAAEAIWKQLGHVSTLLETGWDRALTEQIVEGMNMPIPEVLFRKIEQSEIAKEIEQLQQGTATTAPALTREQEISIEEVRKLDLRVATIVEAKKVPKSKKLLELKVDLGSETRTIVSGIAENYTAEELVGKNVVVIANLAPAKLMGVESHGMLLAASHEKLLKIVEVPDLPPGSAVS